MSRSYKHTPGFVDNSDSHNSKKIASRIIRRMNKRGVDIPNGNAYRKFMESWDIHDFRFMAHTKQELNHMVEMYDGKKYRLFMK